MKIKHIMIFLCGLMAVAGTACKNGDNPSEPTDQTVKRRHLVIKVQSDEGQGAKVSPRRMPNATIEDLGQTLYAEWNENDPVSYCNLSHTDGSSEVILDGTMTAKYAGHRTDFEGDVICTSNDYLAIVYPATDLKTLSFVDNTSFPYGDGIHCKYRISLAGQDGTLEKLATQYHYVYGRAHVLSTVSDTYAEATMDKMKSLLTVCKFSFVEIGNESAGPLPIKSLSIRYGGNGSDANKYPQSALVEAVSITEHADVHAVKEDVTAPLTITCASELNEVYVVLLPEIASRTYQFTVTNDNGTYAGTAEAWLKEGEYVPATGLKLTKQN